MNKFELNWSYWRGGFFKPESKACRYANCSFMYWIIWVQHSIWLLSSHHSNEHGLQKHILEQVATFRYNDYGRIDFRVLECHANQLSLIWKKRFQLDGTLVNRNKGRSGRPRTGRSAANIAAVQRELRQNPRTSSRRNGVPNVSRSAFLRIVKKDINWHPYRILRCHGLKPGDSQRRAEHARQGIWMHC